jgi:hypothetical protein
VLSQESQNPELWATLSFPNRSQEMYHQNACLVKVKVKE